MTFPVKDWKNLPNVTTPLSESALEDLETRLGSYAEVPHGHVETSAVNTTISGVLVDVPLMTCDVELLYPGHIIFWASFEMESGGGLNSVIGVAAQVNGVDHLEHQAHLLGAGDRAIGSIVHHVEDVGDTSFAPGIYTAKLRFRRVSGAGTPALNNCSMLVDGRYHG